METAKIVLMLSVSLFLGACATTPNIDKLSKAPKNAEHVIGEYGFWTRNCDDRHFDIYIEQYPEGGDLRFEVGSLVIPDDPEIGLAGDCVGQYVRSKRLVYVPHENFEGIDTVKYVVKSSMVFSDKAYTVNIEVQQSIKQLDSVRLHPNVTFFVGENGSGKSTLLEAIAVAFGFNPEGRSGPFACATIDHVVSTAPIG